MEAQLYTRAEGLAEEARGRHSGLMALGLSRKIPGVSETCRHSYLRRVCGDGRWMLSEAGCSFVFKPIDSSRERFSLEFSDNHETLISLDPTSNGWIDKMYGYLWYLIDCDWLSLYRIASICYCNWYRIGIVDVHNCISCYVLISNSVNSLSVLESYDQNFQNN